jgi:hypothetical protein
VCEHFIDSTAQLSSLGGPQCALRARGVRVVRAQNTVGMLSARFPNSMLRRRRVNAKRTFHSIDTRRNTFRSSTYGG